MTSSTARAGARVSVIVPAYNRERFVGAAIESVRAQTFADWELIVVDDGSRDRTAAVVESFLSDPRIRLHRQPNSGQATARNVGLRCSSAEFVCFLDSDNKWTPGKLAMQVELLERHPDVDVVYGDTQLIDENDAALPGGRMNRHSGAITRPLLLHNFVTFNTAITRRPLLDRIGGLDESIRRADDYDLWLRASAHGRFLYVPETWALYRVMEDQISSDKEGRFESNRRIIEKFFREHPEFSDARTVAETWGRFYVRRARYRAARRHFGAAFEDLARAWRHQPLSVQPWRALARIASLTASRR
ncbi:MAG: glycosyltransferase [Steroidobacteraceae bacterium]|nr:glycosyltransferase [Steroidobacteraceae bacterium]